VKPGKGVDPRAFAAAREAIEQGRPVQALVELASSGKAARRGVEAALTGTDAATESARDALASLVGDDLPPDASVARLLRRAARLEESARVRSNPIVRNDPFDCLHCGFEVRPVDRGPVRNHCPRCLRSRHVDGPVPGDRSSDCGGLMDPGGYERSGDLLIVTHRCRQCGHERRNRLYPDADPEPDQLDVLYSRGQSGA